AAARLRGLRPELRLVFATASDPHPLWRAAAAAGVADRLHVLPLSSEDERAKVHAVADVAIVPRRAAGGLPIKLLEALARGVPVATTRRASAGLPLAGAAIVAPDDDVAALCAAALEALGRASALADAGRAYLAREHAPARFVDALRALLATSGSESAR